MIQRQHGVSSISRLSILVVSLLKWSSGMITSCCLELSCRTIIGHSWSNPELTLDESACRRDITSVPVWFNVLDASESISVVLSTASIYITFHAASPSVFRS